MKKVMRYAMLIMLVRSNAVAESTELFPMSDIRIGLSVKELVEKYPPEKHEFHKRPYEIQDLSNTLLFYEISENKFWDTLIFSIKDSKVETLNYFYENNDLFLQKASEDDQGKIVENLKPLFMQLKKELGSTFEKKITHGETTGERSAMYIWKREKDVVAFSHSPVSKYKKGDMFDCGLAIAARIEDIAGMYSRIATNSLPEDKLLWADAMGEETASFPIRWVYACAALCALCAVACLIRRKR